MMKNTCLKNWEFSIWNGDNCAIIFYWFGRRILISMRLQTKWLNVTTVHWVRFVQVCYTVNKRSKIGPDWPYPSHQLEPYWWAGCDPAVAGGSNKLKRSTVEYWKGIWVCDLLGESGLAFVIQDHTDHGASEERSFSSSDQLPWQQARNCRARQRNRALNLKMKTIILKVLNHSSVFQILEVIFGCQELQSAVWNACFPGLPHGDLLLTYRCKFWLQYGYLGTLNACDQWPIDLTLQNRVHFVFIAKFVERLPTTLPVNIWCTHLFEIEHRWAKWLISDPSPKGTRWINDPSSDRADQWSNKSLSRVDLINHWSENGFARKEPHRSEILIRILSNERTLSETWAVRGHALIINEQKKIRFENRTTNLFFQTAIYRLSDRSLCRYMKHSINPKSFTTFSETSHSLVVLH